MKRKETGITLIALVITIIIILILAGITLGNLNSKDGTINKANKAKSQGERESIIEKIEADLYSEKVKTGKTPNKSDLEKIARKYGTINEDILTTTDGDYEIELTEILGWKDE